MSFCLPKEITQRFINSLKEGELDPGKLSQLTSKERRARFTEIIGPEDAGAVNALFESKLLLKNQQAGMITWAKTVAGLKEPIRRDIISRIEKMDKVLDPKEEALFLEDLAAKKLGTEVSFEEAKAVADFSKDLQEAKSKIPEDSKIGSKERLEYGTKYTLFQDFLKDLKSSHDLTFTEWLKSPKAMFKSLTGTTKSILSALDNSFFGRQGIKTLYTHPSVWMNAFLKSWKDIGKELKGTDAMTPIKADIFSRPNALNRKYHVGGYDLGLTTEEAFPSALPERIPVLGRLFKASESAFNGAALRMRADLADMMIKKIEDSGGNALDPFQAKSMGKLVNSMTGRGNIPVTPGTAEVINSTFFSLRFLKSNFDALTAHIFDSEMSKLAKKEAAINIAKIVGTTATIFYIAEQLDPGSATKNPGYITHGATRFDISGGVAGIPTLAYKIYKKLTDNKAPKYGESTSLDLLVNFGLGKLSPIAGVLRDVLQEKNFKGKKPTATSIAQDLTVPLPIQTFQDLQNNPQAADTLGSMILDGLGIGTYTPPVYKK